MHLLLQHQQQQQPGAVDMQQQLFAIQAVSLMPATQSECCACVCALERCTTRMFVVRA